MTVTVPSPSFASKPSGLRIFARRVKLQVLGAVVNGNLVPPIENHIPGLGGDFPVVPGEGRSQGSHLLKAAVVRHGNGDRAFFQQGGKGIGGAAIFQIRQKCIISYGNFQSPFPL